VKTILPIVMAGAICVTTVAATTIAYSQQARPSFAELKQRIIERLNSELACVQAAQDENALRACRPQRRGGEGPPPQ